LGVTDLADGCPAADVDAADLGGRHTQNRVGALLTQQLDGRTSGTCELGAGARLQLDVVDGGTGRDVAQRQVVAHLDVGVGAGLHDGALLETLRGEDVTLLAVEVVEQSDVGGAVRVVLDVSDLGQHAVLVVATEVDDAVTTLVSATLVTAGDVAVHVAATGLVDRAQQRLLRGRTSDLVEHGDGALAATRGCRLVLANSHNVSFSLDP